MERKSKTYKKKSVLKRKQPVRDAPSGKLPAKELPPKIEKVEKRPEVLHVEKLPEKTDTVDSNSDAVTKILVQNEDEITFLIEQVEEAPSQRVVVAIPAGSDLLISSVGMRLLAKHADDAKKLVVLVTDDGLGKKVAEVAGLTVAGATVDIDDQMWIAARHARQRRSEPPPKPEPAVIDSPTDAEEPPSSTVATSIPSDRTMPSLVNKDFQDNFDRAGQVVHGVPVRDEAEGEVMSKGVVSGEPVGTSEPSVAEADEPMDLGRSRTEGLVEDAGGVVPALRKVKAGAFEMTIDEGVVPKASSVIPTVTEQTDVVDVETSAELPRRSAMAGLVGRDFSDFSPSSGVRPMRSDTDRSSGGRLPVVALKGTGVLAVISTLFSGLAQKAKAGLTSVGARKGLKKLLIPLAFAVVVGGVAAYWMLPRVVINLQIESIPAAYQGDVTALVSAEDVDVVTLVIPARSEEDSKNGSDTANATGVAVRGDKANGDVTIVNKTFSQIVLPAGTLLSNGGLNFSLESSVTVPKATSEFVYGQANGSVIAQKVGTEYNLATGTTFTVGSHPLSEMAAANAAAFTGGTKQEYKVVSQADIDKAADTIKKQLFAESKITLSTALEGSKWVFVELSIKNDLDGNVTSDVPAGAESATVNVDVKTKSTALYYDGEALDELIQRLLLNDFSEEELENLELAEDIVKTITVKSASAADGTIVLTVDISGFAMPVLDTDSVERRLYGKAWAEGLGYLNELDYVSGDPEIKFYPEWFPKFLWRMPSRQGRISVNVRNVAPEEPDESVTPDAADAADGEEAPE